MIKNQTRNAILASEYTLCNSLFSRMKGLMFSRTPQSLVMTFPNEQKIGIHMFFVFFPIDVLWLDAEQRVVAVREYMQPFSLPTTATSGVYLVEIPAGIVKESETKIGDKIIWLHA